MASTLPSSRLRNVRTVTAALKKTQEALGRFQDRSVLLERLKTGLDDARSGKIDPLAYGLLVGVIAAEHGRRKAEAVRNAIEGEVTSQVPASILQSHEHATLFLDEPAATLLLREVSVAKRRLAFRTKPHRADRGTRC